MVHRRRRLRRLRLYESPHQLRRGRKASVGKLALPPESPEVMEEDKPRIALELVLAALHASGVRFDAEHPLDATLRARFCGFNIDLIFLDHCVALYGLSPKHP